MAKLRKPAAARKAKSKVGKRRAGKKPVKRRVAKKAKRPAKKIMAKKSRKPASKRKSLSQRPQSAIPVIDEPAPGVVRVTEIETTGVAVPDSEEEAGDGEE